ncbi:putative type 1 membrane protein [Hibiscus trionum]|uniref:Type 1 membrane protein n=1 Tax=Hibiscus trionum TaxID=183268 RepID=A0A9W7H4S1_HIBTR|nr:putative type 1 membrane protein [Hibiscus trionum]
MKNFSIFIISLLFFSFPRAESSGSLFFIDSSNHQFLRSQSSNDVSQSEPMLLSEVGATVSVLLGFATPATLSAAGSSTLDEVLVPNPFDRPRAVFMLEVGGIDDPLVVDPKNALLSKALKSSVNLGSIKADIQLPDENEASVVSLDEPLRDYTEEEINDFASWLGGSYEADATKPLHGVLTIPLADVDSVNLRMSEKAHKEFASRLLALYHNTRKAMEMHGQLSKTSHRPAELIMGSFNGIKVLLEQKDRDSVDKLGTKLLLATLMKIYDSLQKAYGGQIVGVIVFNGAPQPESKTLMNVMYSSRPYSRWLEETKKSLNTNLASQVLVRRTLAWVTGVVLIIATLLGVHFLLNMPLTRDTLLYSNVKLD